MGTARFQVIASQKEGSSFLFFLLSFPPWKHQTNDILQLDSKAQGQANAGPAPLQMAPLAFLQYRDVEAIFLSKHSKYSWAWDLLPLNTNVCFNFIGRHVQNEAIMPENSEY